MKWAIIITVAVVALLGFGGCAAIVAGLNEATKDAPVQRPGDSAPEKPGEKQQKPKVKLTAQMAGTDELGSTLVKVKITNNTDRPISINSLNFEAVDSANNVYPADAGSGTLKLMDLAPGMSTSGTVGFTGSVTPDVVIMNGLMGDEIARAAVTE